MLFSGLNLRHQEIIKEKTANANGGWPILHMIHLILPLMVNKFIRRKGMLLALLSIRTLPAL